VIPPTDASVSTRHGDTYYIHVLDYVSECVKLKDIPASVTQARMRDGTTLEIERHEKETLVCLPENKRDPYDTVVVLS
jgi:alpha-L-fucosidase